jgi:hypothetical protein
MQARCHAVHCSRSAGTGNRAVLTCPAAISCPPSLPMTASSPGVRLAAMMASCWRQSFRGCFCWHDKASGCPAGIPTRAMWSVRRASSANHQIGSASACCGTPCAPGEAGASTLSWSPAMSRHSVCSGLPDTSTQLAIACTVDFVAASPSRRAVTIATGHSCAAAAALHMEAPSDQLHQVDTCWHIRKLCVQETQSP